MGAWINCLPTLGGENISTCLVSVVRLWFLLVDHGVRDVNRVIASVLCSAHVCDMVLPLRQLRSGCHIDSSLHAVLASQVRPLEHHAGTLPRQGPCRHSVTASGHTRQTLHVQVSLHGPTLLQTPPASYLGAHRLLPVATLLLAVRPDWRLVPPGVLFAHGLKRHSSNSQPSWPFFAVSVALPWLPSMPKPMRATRRHESADDLVEVEIEAAADEAAALISERQACASDSEIVLDPLAAGTEAVVVAGHRPELVGVRVMILPSTDLTSRNVRPLQGLQVQKMRVYCGCTTPAVVHWLGGGPRRWAASQPPLASASSAFDALQCKVVARMGVVCHVSPTCCAETRPPRPPFGTSP